MRESEVIYPIRSGFQAGPCFSEVAIPILGLVANNDGVGTSRKSLLAIKKVSLSARFNVFCRVRAFLNDER